MSTPAPAPGPLDDETGTSDTYGVTDVGRHDATWWIVGATFLIAIALMALGANASSGVAKFLCFGAAVLLLIVSLGYAVLVGAIGWLDRRDHSDRSDRTPPPP